MLLAACGDEQPLGIGSELLPEQALRSFEVILEPEQFLLRDTAFALYGDVAEADFTLLARDFEGALNAHGFARFQLPAAIAVTDTLGVARVDSTPRFVRGEVVLQLDSLDENTVGNFRVALQTIAEAWDPDSANWEFRRTGVRWSTPGGTPGILVDTALIGRDSVVLQVDSMTMRAWADTSNGARGARLTLLDPNSRLRSAHPQLRVYARSRFKPDTTFMVISQAPLAKFDYRPRLPATSGNPWVSGLPAWRTFLQFRPDLEDLDISCGAGCILPLGATSITRAELMLQPVVQPAGFSLEKELQPAAYNALVAPEFPLERTPVGSPIGTVEGGLAPDRFAAGAAPAYLVVTDFVQRAVGDTVASSAGGSGVPQTDWLVILPINTATFGIGTFAPSPRLRLVLSVAREIQLP
jgi:hypothetical protein